LTDHAALQYSLR